MSDVPPPPLASVYPGGARGAPRQSPVDAFTRGWFTALVRGLVAFVVMAGVGQAAAFVVYLVGGRPGSAGTFAKLGWFYFDWFHHIALTASVPNVSIPDLPATGGLLPGGASIRFHVGLALMLGTFLAVWLLYGAGKAVADRADGGGLARVLHGLKVAPVYAVPCFLFSLLVSLKASIPPSSFASGSVDVKSSAAQSFLIPLLIAAAAGAAGGLRSARYELLTREPWGRRVSGALAGGFRMFVLGIVLSFVGLLVLAVVHPDATKAYFRVVSEPPEDETALIIGHHVLVLPNQSMWVLVPAMGGCDGVYGNGESSTFLCYWKYPKQVSVSGPGRSPGSVLSGLPQVQTAFGTAPIGYFLFLLVPAISVLLGGRHAVRKRVRFRYEAAAVGAAAGVTFGILVAVGSWFASLSAGVLGNVAGFSTNLSVTIGPDVVIGGLIALVWGIVGGGIGGWWAGRELPARGPLRAAGSMDVPEPPPESELAEPR
jgi:hypothetical protein